MPANLDTEPDDSNAALVCSIVQQLSDRLEDKLEDILYAALQTTFDRIFAGHMSTMLSKVHSGQQDFLDNMEELIRNEVVRNDCSGECWQDTSVGHTTTATQSTRGRPASCLQSPGTAMGHASTLPERENPAGAISIADCPKALSTWSPKQSGDMPNLPGIPSKGRLKLHQMDKLLTQDILRKDWVFRERESQQPSGTRNQMFLPKKIHPEHVSEEDEDVDGNKSKESQQAHISEIGQCQSVVPGCAQTTPPRAPSRQCSRMHVLRDRVVTRLVTPSEQVEVPSDATMKVVAFLCHSWGVWGIIPLSQSRRAEWHRRLMILVAALSASWTFYSLATDPVHFKQNIIHSLMAVSNLATLLLLRPVSYLLGPFNILLVHHAIDYGFLTDWVADGMYNLKIATATWTLAGLVCIAVCLVGDGVGIFSAIVMFYHIGLFCATMHCLCQLLAFLGIMIDRYCEKCLEGLRYNLAVFSWNTLQSLLRHVAKVMENCLVCLQISLMLAMLWLFCRFMEIARPFSGKASIELTSEFNDEGTLSNTILGFLSILVIAPSLAMLFVKAAVVTEKCSRVPAFVNAMLDEPEEQMNVQRQYLVNYIMNSDAGFYIKGVRLSAAIIVKIFYVLGALVSTLVTTAFSMSERS